MEKMLLSTEEACEFLGVSRPTFNLIVKNGRLGFVLVGKRKRFTKGELEKWLEEEITFHTQFTKEEKSITRISRSAYSTEKKCRYGKAQGKQPNTKQNNTASTDLTNSSEGQSEEKLAS